MTVPQAVEALEIKHTTYVKKERGERGLDTDLGLHAAELFGSTFEAIMLARE